MAHSALRIVPSPLVGVPARRLVRRVRAVKIVAGGREESAPKRTSLTRRNHGGFPRATHELSVTSTNDIVDAVIRRALLAATFVESSHDEFDAFEELVQFGDEDEHPGTRHADDVELLDALTNRWKDLTSSEASDVLHAVSRSPRFEKKSLSAPRGRLLDALARQDGPFRAIQELYLEDSLPLAWMRPRRRRPGEPVEPSAAETKGEDQKELDSSVPSWTGALPDSGHGVSGTWGMPYEYTVRDIARLAYSLASFPKPIDQKSEEDRALTAKAAAHVAARFSREAWTWEHADEADLATLVWSFAEIPTKYLTKPAKDGSKLDGETHAPEQDAFLRKACRRALRELSRAVRKRAGALSAEEIYAAARAYERAFDDCFVDPNQISSRAFVHIAPAVGEASESNAVSFRGDESSGEGDSPDETPPLAETLGRVEDFLGARSEEEDAPGAEPGDRAEQAGVVERMLLERPHTSDEKKKLFSSGTVADGRSVANRVLRALAPQALLRASEFSSDQLGYIADACARFGVHPKGEGMWHWASVVRKRRREERDAAKGNGKGEVSRIDS